jgi:mannitol 2-dehydrogenase
MSARASALTLDPARLAAIAEEVPAPSYDRSRLSVGTVHFGVGGFHRAHQAMYLDRLMSAGEAYDWAICGVGVMDADRQMRDALRAQGYLYTLIQKNSDGVFQPRVIGSIIDYLYAPDDPLVVIERLANPATRIVSLTITEGGYGIDDTTGVFDSDALGVTADLAPGGLPRTVFGLITEGLARRREQGTAPFTVVSCDNLPGNGRLARTAFTSFARLRDPHLAEWIDREVSFPNSMVDRITPATTDADREALRRDFGIEDRWPVVCEPFVQWVLEDTFSSERPPYERAGVQLVDDVEPYELMKLRLLNGSHQGLAYFGRLCGYQLVHEAAQDPLFRTFLRGYMDDEAAPTLEPVPGVDLENYKRTLIERFSNPEIRDTIARLCAESSDRIPKWVVPVARIQLERDGELARSAAIIASWARYAEGVDEHGARIEVVDRRREQVMAAARDQRDDPQAFLRQPELFGELPEHERFLDAYLATLESLHERGARATLEAIVEAHG